LIGLKVVAVEPFKSVEPDPQDAEVRLLRVIGLPPLAVYGAK
jgi:hypothetical protein